MEEALTVEDMDLSSTYRKDNLYGFEMKAGDLDLRRQYNRPKRTCYDIKQLWQRSHEMINLALQGLNNKDIAGCLNVSPEAVSACLNSELGVKKLSEMRKLRDGKAVEVSKKINELVAKALKTYNDIFDAPTDQVNYKLKKETADTIVLEVAGHRAPTRIDSRSLSIHATPDEIEEFKKRGIATAKAAGMLIEEGALLT